MIWRWKNRRASVCYIVMYLRLGPCPFTCARWLQQCMAYPRAQPELWNNKMIQCSCLIKHIPESSKWLPCEALWKYCRSKSPRWIQGEMSAIKCNLWLCDNAEYQGDIAASKSNLWLCDNSLNHRLFALWSHIKPCDEANWVLCSRWRVNPL